MGIEIEYLCFVQMVKKLHQYVKGLETVAPEYAVGFERADKTFLYQLVIDPKSRKLVPLNPYPPDVKEGDVKFAGPYPCKSVLNAQRCSKYSASLK